MGFLSRSAEKTFNKARSRAYVPEWFRPFSYVAAGVVAVGVVLSGVLGGAAEDASVETETSEVTAADIFPTPDVQIPVTSETPGANSDQTGGTSDSSGVVLISTPVGGAVEVPAAAVQVAQAASVALFTGNFSEVSVVPGQNPPTVANPWPQAAAGEPETAAPSPSGTTFTLVITIDPDGASGSEPPRPVSVTVQNSNGTWMYVPLASG